MGIGGRSPRRALIFAALAAVTLVCLPAALLAQFGHPLKGQWSGEWGARTNTNRVLLDFDWDGKDITGRINPGPGEATVKSVTFDYTNPASWGVKVQAEGKDATGKTVAISIDGKLENIGAYVRHFHGTWTQGSQKGPFSVTRN
jgi:hypothetical protein